MFYFQFLLLWKVTVPPIDLLLLLQSSIQIKVSKQEKIQLEEAGDSRSQICLSLHKHTSAFPNHQIELSLPCIFCASVLRHNRVIMKWSVWVRQTGPEQMTTPGTACQFYASSIGRLMWNGWSPKHLNCLKSCTGLTSKLSLSTKAARWGRRARGIEVTSTVASKTCRICGGGAAAIVCCAGVLPRTCSEDFQKASELRARCYLSQVPSTCWGHRQWKACGIRYRDGGCL